MCLSVARTKEQLLAQLKQQYSDFIVEEVLGWPLSGEGEHHFYYVEKQGLTTEQAARLLAKALAVPAKQVSFSGRKDKVALTRQWFSVQRPGVALVPEVNIDGLTILAASLHNRKLKTGAHRSNRFAITLRGELDNDWMDRWQLLLRQGAANYFGEQRFGIANLDKATAWFAGAYRPKKYEQGMLLSAVRSQMFNEYLDERQRQYGLSQAMVGDVCLLGDSRSGFVVTPDELVATQTRLDAQGIHISGPLFGLESGLQPCAKAAELEALVAAKHPKWLAGLAERKVNAARRATRLLLSNARQSQTAAGQLFEFELPAGAFATSVLAQVTEFEDVSRAQYPTD